MYQLSDLNVLKAVAERDIDLLLLEELHASPQFRAWFGQKCGLENAEAHHLFGAWHSVSEASFGESDLIAVLEDAAGIKYGLLIENKIDADPQPAQGERYRIRAASGVDKGHWNECCTCLVAPDRYLQADRTSGYDHRISYEEIRDWIRSADRSNARYGFKAMVIQEAIEQHRRGYRPEPHADVTAFYQDYYRTLMAECPELRMRKPGGVPAKSDWVRFYPQGLAARFRLRHKMRFGRVDLEMAGCGDLVDRIKELDSGMLDQDMDILRVNKSAAICAFVPTVDRFAGLAEQIEAVRMAHRAGLRLWALSDRVTWPTAPV